MRAALAALLALGLAAFCDGAHADVLDPADCVQPTSTMQHDLCQAAEYERRDAELAQTLAATQVILADAGACISSACDQAQHALAAAHQAWLDFREHDCQAAYAIAIDGSGRNDARLDCLIEHTRIRTGQLQRLQRL